MAIDLIEQPTASIETDRRDLRGHRDGGNLEVRRRRIAMDEPRIGRPAQKARVLPRPGEVAVVPDMLGQHDRCRHAAGARLDAVDQSGEARPVVRRADAGTLDVRRLVRHPGQHVVAARGMGVVARRNRPQHGEAMRLLGQPRHQLAHLQAR